MACNEVCKNYKATKPQNGGRYENGQKDVRHVKSLSIMMEHIVHAVMYN